MVIILTQRIFWSSSEWSSQWSHLPRWIQRFEDIQESVVIADWQVLRLLNVFLNQAGIYDVSVERVSGNLTDHYDPKNKVLRLSDATYGSDSIAAIGVGSPWVWACCTASARICTIEDSWGYGSSCESWIQSFLVVYSRWSDPWNESDIIECWNFIIFISQWSFN